jgi:hypothetical protein
LLACGCSLERGGGAPAPRPGDLDASHVGGAHDDAAVPHDASAGIDGGDGDGDGDGDGGGDGDDDSGVEQPVDSGQPPPPDAGEPDSGEPPDSRDAGDEPGGFTPGPGQVGAPCMNDDECSGFNATCAKMTEGSGPSMELPGGYCTRPCLTLCGLNERCVEENFCVRTCTDDDDCRKGEGYVCRDQVCTLPGL